MRCRILALLFLLGAVSLAQADYAVFIANLNAKTPAETNPGGGLDGGPGGGLPTVPMGFGPGPMGGMLGMRPPTGPGGLGGFPGMYGSPEDAADEDPYLVVAVVPGRGFVAQKKLFDANQPIWFTHQVVPGGAKLHIQKKTSIYEVVPLVDGSGKILPTITAQFNTKYDNATKNKASAAELRELAAWALGHGLLGLGENEKGFITVMDRLAENNPADPAAIAYKKVKADLAKPLSSEDTASLWRKRLVETYKATQTEKHHYAILHNFATDALSEVKSQIDDLEKAFQSFFYWWALQSIALPVPTTRQVAILADSKQEEFDRLKRQLDGSPAVAGSSIARREGLVILSARRNDAPYKALMGVSTAEMWEKGYDRNALLKAQYPTTGLPREIVQSNPGQAAALANGPRTTAMLLKAMEIEWERTSTSHQVARQMLFATGLVPRTVHVPEWLQFGIGSFFEAPLQSPWGGPGAPNAYWLPRFKEYRGKLNDPKTWKYGHPNNSSDILSQVVTDELLRGKLGMPAPDEQHLRYGRAAAWSLTYFLLHRERDKLRAFFKELGRLPRDVALSDEVLKRCFARAFDCVNADGSVHSVRFKDLADRWLGFVNDQTLEAEVIHREIRKFFAQMKPPTAPGTTTTPGLFTPGAAPPPGTPATPGPGGPRPGQRPRRGDS